MFEDGETKPSKGCQATLLGVPYQCGPELLALSISSPSVDSHRGDSIDPGRFQGFLSPVEAVTRAKAVKQWQDWLASRPFVDLSSQFGHSPVMADTLDGGYPFLKQAPEGL